MINVLNDCVNIFRANSKFLSESHYLELGCLSDKTAHILSIDINEKITFRRVRHLISLIVLPYT